MNAIDETKLHETMGKMLMEIGAAANGALVMTGDMLGLYSRLAELGSATPAELAEASGTAERYVREWLGAQAASGLVCYDGATEKFFMTPEQTAILADELSPTYMGGAFYGIASIYRDTDKLVDAFKNGGGIDWGAHDNCLFCGTAKFFRPTYKANLIGAWLPALEGVQEKLERGARVADVGCGFGVSTMMMAEAFPNSEFIGYDYHAPSVEHARQHAAETGLPNVRFETATAQDFPGQDYDLVTIFDALHDMGDPQGAAAHIRQTLKPDGTMMVVEPMAGDRIEDNLNPVGRAYYSFSTAICTPAALSQSKDFALGAQAGQKRLTEVITAGGFAKVRRAAETPFNMVLEARGA